MHGGFAFLFVGSLCGCWELRLYRVYSSLKKKESRVVEFCPVCGCRLVPRKTQANGEVSVVLACSKCEYVKKDVEGVDFSAGKAIQRKRQESVTVISEEDQKMSTLPTIKVECPKCGNHLVYVWQVQTRGGDEASTQFMRCTECGHTFREYT